MSDDWDDSSSGSSGSGDSGGSDSWSSSSANDDSPGSGRSSDDSSWSDADSSADDSSWEETGSSQDDSSWDERSSSSDDSSWSSGDSAAGGFRGGSDSGDGSAEYDDTSGPEPDAAQRTWSTAERLDLSNLLRTAAVIKAAADAQDGVNGGLEGPRNRIVVSEDDNGLGDGDEPPSGKPPQRPPTHKKRVWQGIGIGLALHLLLLFVPPLYFGIGIVQCIYIIPALIICRKTPGLVQGLLIAAGVTFLLNAACFGYIVVSLR